MSESLAAALAQFQAALPRVAKGDSATVKTKDGGSYKYSYADLADVSAVVLPLLGKHGLSFLAKPSLVDGRFVLAYKLMHTSGEAETGEYPLPQQGTSQEIGSAITYARRYALCSVVGVAPDKDDDGEAANNRPMRVAERQPPPQPQWDPVEQDTLCTGYLAEIEDAKDDAELQAIGRNLQSARKSGDLSPTSYDRLVKAGAARKAGLMGGAAA